MNLLFNIAISLVASAVIFVGGMNVPASNFSLKNLSEPIFGAFTEITTATNLADFPTTYNANLTKTIEVGTTSVASITTLAGLTSASALATVGTLTSGSLGSGFTAVVVARGGTGSTTLSSNQVLLGNGTGNVSVVAGLGSSGQFLTSGGAGTPPTWTTSAVDQALDYNFTGSAFRVKNLHASSTAANPLVLNGVSYSMPSANGNASSTLSNDGSGVLTWGNAPVRFLYINSNINVSTSNTSSTTLLTVLIPANTLITTNKTLQFDFQNTLATDCRFDVVYGSGSATTTLAYNASSVSYMNLSGKMYPLTTTSQRTISQAIGVDVGLFANNTNDFWTAVATTYTLTSPTYLALRARSVGGGDTCLLYGATVQVNTY